MADTDEKAMLAARIPIRVKKALERMAKAEHRSASQQIVRLLEAALIEAGYLDDKAKPKAPRR